MKLSMQKQLIGVLWIVAGLLAFMLAKQEDDFVFLIVGSIYSIQGVFNILSYIISGEKDEQ